MRFIIFFSRAQTRDGQTAGAKSLRRRSNILLPDRFVRRDDPYLNGFCYLPLEFVMLQRHVAERLSPPPVPLLQ
jgi:hypothetical protein